jgi:hypothetical protein
LPNPTGTGNLWYNHDIIVDPSNSNVVYLGTTRLSRFNGSVWSDITDGIHVDQHALAFVGGRLIIGNDGGVWSTINGGLTYTNHNTNLSITQFYDGSIHPTNPTFALGGSQDNGTEKWSGTEAWQWIIGGDGAANAISATNPDTNWAISFQNLGIRRTINGGATFTNANTPESEDNTKAPFISRFEKCPANDDVFSPARTIYGELQFLWRSPHRGLIISVETLLLESLPSPLPLQTLPAIHMRLVPQQAPCGSPQMAV